MNNLDHGLIDLAEEFLNRYYHDEIAELATVYPNDQESLWIDYGNLWQFDADFADDFRTHPSKILRHLEHAIDLVDIPVDIDLSGATVRVTGLEDAHTYAPGEVRKEQVGKYVGVSGTLERMTTTSDIATMVAFECGRCGCVTEIDQTLSTPELSEPHECYQCERKGPFTPMDTESDWSDYAKVRAKARPDADAASEGKLSGYVLDDLIDTGGDAGLMSRVGEPVTLYGIVERVQKTGRNVNESLFDHTLDVRAVEFQKDDDTVDVAAHRDEFEQLAASDDPIGLWQQSIAPQLHTTDAWDAAMEFSIAYLFGAARIDIPQGPTYRGDLHFLMVSDFGMGKSTFKEDIEAYSPKCISKSTTALSSGVGLTAAAVKDDFGAGQWTIKPGLLVRANGGHLILDEIDKGPDELTDMNDALEGEQVVDIEKAGQSATYESRTAVMALGNPDGGRFNQHDSIADQLGIDESLLSRFDGIVTMQDESDAEQDADVAETYGRAYTEAQEYEFGDREDFDALSRPVPINVGQAWIKYARENVTPILSYEQFEELQTWYAEEVRQLNKTFAEDGEGGDMPVPATVRELAAAVKMSIAFARVELCEQVHPRHVKRAKKLGKRLVKQNWTGERFDATHSHGGSSQATKMDRLTASLPDRENAMTPAEIATTAGVNEQWARERLGKLAQKGEVLEPRTGVFAEI